MANENNAVDAAEEKGVEDTDLELEDDKDEDEDESSDDGEKGEKDKKDDKKSDKDEKPETPEARRARLQRMLDRHDKKHGKPAPKDINKSEKSTELDYGQKAFLRADGIKGTKELALVQEYRENTGKSLEEIIENKHFINDLKDLRDEKSSDDAVPKGKQRGTNSSKDSVDYWLAKDELPPKEQSELRRKVVNAKIARDTSNNPFA